MPAVRFKQYLYTAAAATNVPVQGQTAAAPQVDQRCYLLIQNTAAANSALVQFKNPIKGNGSDLILAAGQAMLFDQTLPDGTPNIPIDAIYIGSQAGATVAILEGVYDHG